jgi:Lon protease-like protein
MSSAEPIPIPSHFSRLAIFPLANVHLFPHALLPLHVFEPRYRELLRDALKEERLIAIASLEPGFEKDYQGRPPVRPIVGVGQIIGHEPLEEGRANILLRGVTRARIERELPPHELYRRVEARTVADEFEPGFKAEAARETLALLANKLAASLPSGGDTLRELVRATLQPSALADVLAAALVTDPDARLQLLEEPRLRLRADRVADEIATVLARLTATTGPAN